MELANKAILVAGGGGNLGRAIVEALVKREARVLVADIRPSLEWTDPGVSYYECDAADEASSKRAVAKAASDVGKIHGLVNCTGLIHSEPLVNILDPSSSPHRFESWDRVLRSNLYATFVLGAQVAEHMVRSRVKGTIVNFSSIAAHGNPGQSAYAAAKAGVEALTSVWSRELGALGIRVVAIAPGFIDTASTAAALPADTVADLKRRVPLLRLGKPGDIANAVLFALENEYVNGTTIAVDGGLII